MFSLSVLDNTRCQPTEFHHLLQELSSVCWKWNWWCACQWSMGAIIGIRNDYSYKLFETVNIVLILIRFQEFVKVIWSILSNLINWRVASYCDFTNKFKILWIIYNLKFVSFHHKFSTLICIGSNFKTFISLERSYKWIYTTRCYL